jgi:hypothetical protein
MEAENVNPNVNPKRKSRRQPPRLFPDSTVQNPPFPYVTPIKQKRANLNPVIQQLYANGELIPTNFGEKPIPDIKLKTLTKYYRPSFSPYFNSWVIDIAYVKGDPYYLFIINENTRYLIAYVIKDRSAEEILRVFEDFAVTYGVDQSSGQPVPKPIRIKGDGEHAFVPMASEFEKRYGNDKFHFHFRTTPMRLLT